MENRVQNHVAASERGAESTANSVQSRRRTHINTGFEQAFFLTAQIGRTARQPMAQAPATRPHLDRISLPQPRISLSRSEIPLEFSTRGKTRIQFSSPFSTFVEQNVDNFEYPRWKTYPPSLKTEFRLNSALNCAYNRPASTKRR